MRTRRNLILAILSVFLLSLCYLVYLRQNDDLVSLVSRDSVEDTYGDIAENTMIIEVKDGAHDFCAEPFQYKNDDKDLYCFFLPSFAQSDDAVIRMNSGMSARIDKSDGNSFIVHDRDSYELFPINDTFGLTFIDIEGNDAIGCDVCIFQSELPAVFVDTDSGSFDYVDEDKDNREAGCVTIFDSDGSLVYKDDFTHITGRGNQTWDYEKKSYSLKLKNKKNLFGMGKAKDWILLSNVMDDTYLRNKITYDMAIDAGMLYSPESEYVDVYFNGTYHGMYLLCEKIEADSSRVAVANLDKENFKVNNLGKDEAPELIVEKNRRYVGLSESPADISGGYIVERDEAEKYANAMSGFKSCFSKDEYSLKSPEYATCAEIDFIDNLFVNMEKSVFAEDGINPETGKAYSEYIDMDSFAKKFLIEEITKNNGGGATSAYYFKPIDAISEKIYAGPVWDYDKGYGNGYDVLDSDTRSICCQTLNMEDTLLYWALFRKEGFREAVDASYEEFFSEYLQELLDYGIDDYVSDMGVSSRMDMIRWDYIHDHVTGHHYHGDTYEESVEYVKQFIRERKAFLDEVLIEHIPLCEVRMCDSLDDGSILNEDSSPYLGTGTGQDYCIYVKQGETFDSFPTHVWGEEYSLEDTDTGDMYTSEESIHVDRNMRFLVERMWPTSSGK